LQPTAGFMTHVTRRLTAKNRDQLRDPTLGNRVWATFTFKNIFLALLYEAISPIAAPHGSATGLHAGWLCVDVDECAVDRDLCQPAGLCKNTYGSYYCQCQTGHAVKPGSTSCTGTLTHRPSSQTWLLHLHRYTHSQTQQSNLALPAAQVHALTDPAVKPGSTSCTGTPTHRPSSQTWLHHLHRYTHSQTQQSNLTLPAAQVHSLTDPTVKPGSTSCTGRHTHRLSSQTWLHQLHRYTHKPS